MSSGARKRVRPLTQGPLVGGFALYRQKQLGERKEVNHVMGLQW